MGLMCNQVERSLKRHKPAALAPLWNWGSSESRLPYLIFLWNRFIPPSSCFQSFVLFVFLPPTFFHLFFAQTNVLVLVRVFSSVKYWLLSFFVCLCRLSLSTSCTPSTHLCNLHSSFHTCFTLEISFSLLTHSSSSCLPLTSPLISFHLLSIFHCHLIQRTALWCYSSPVPIIMHVVKASRRAYQWEYATTKKDFSHMRTDIKANWGSRFIWFSL